MNSNRLVWLLICLVLPLWTITGLLQAAQPAVSDSIAKLEPALQTAVFNQPPTHHTRFILHIDQPVEWQDNLPLETTARRVALVDRLQETAVTTQSDLLPLLDTLQEAGAVQQYQPLWIINAISVQGSVAALETLTTHPAVSHVTLDEPTATLADWSEINVETMRMVNASLLTATLKNWGLAQIGAPGVWHGLGIDGSGVTIGIMDSGVDYQHPDLLPNYRGNLGGGSFNHAGNWFDAALPTASPVPTDTYGHGTHVAGTAVGQNGIGVAPGAQWIAVNIADGAGIIYESVVHAAFQWLLAPNGDPLLAPDIINGSWGGDGTNDTFAADIDVLREAGILPVFAAGNEGPFQQTINAPGSFETTIAVGASDQLDHLAWFSSRGPSPLTPSIQPQIVAPGTAVLSAQPNGQYATASGTSMATPHTAGTLALMLSANPGLSYAAALQTITQTAVPISSTVPNFYSGWGRLDGLAAVAAVRPHGTLQGVVTGSGVPLPQTAVSITAQSGGQFARFTDATGWYQTPLQSGSYTLTVAAYGYETAVIPNVLVNNGQTHTASIPLTPLPGGRITGWVRHNITGQPIPHVTVSADGTPRTAVTDENGRYELFLPAGVHKLRFSRTGYTVERRTTVLNVGDQLTISQNLATADRLLLVDAGQWNYVSQAAVFQATLNDLNRAYDTVTIFDPIANLPTAELLQQYDTVLWSDPFYSPGFLGLNDVITSYLKVGGNLLITGQNVGVFDGTGFARSWWYDSLQAIFVDKTVDFQPVAGVADTTYAGAVFTLNGGSSANNQFETDVVRPFPNSLTQPIFEYADGRAAGLYAGLCQPHRLIYLGFGLEGVTHAISRADLMQASFDLFAEPRNWVGVDWAEPDVDDFALPGETLTYTLTLRNLSETYTDTFKLNLSGGSWPATVMTPTVTLGPCETAVSIVTLRVPESAPLDKVNTLRLTAVSTLNSAETSRLTLRHKTPGQLLLVDDDRWYDQQPLYAGLVDTLGLSYDIWETGWSGRGRGSPPLELLQAYPYVVWYTAYDWFAPITPDERESLQAYLAGGGRLWLSSQDFLYYNWQSELAQSYLGVLGYREDVSPTIAYGGGQSANSRLWAGPLPLAYGPYQNFSDGLIPAREAAVLLWHDGGMPAAIGHQQNGGRSVFMGFPFETLPTAVQTTTFQQMMGWLTDVGDSTIEVDARQGGAGQTRTFTATVRLADDAPTQPLTLTHPLDADITLLPSSLSGAAYNPASRTILWQGMLAGGQAHQIVYRATTAGGLVGGTAVDATIHLSGPEQLVPFMAQTTTWIDAPNLTQSAVVAVLEQPWATERLTMTMQMVNSGLGAADEITAVLHLPPTLHLLTPTLSSSSGTLSPTFRTLIWRGSLLPAEQATATLAFTRTVLPVSQTLTTFAVFEDGQTATWIRPLELLLSAYDTFFPIFPVAETE